MLIVITDFQKNNSVATGFRNILVLMMIINICLNVEMKVMTIAQVR